MLEFAPYSTENNIMLAIIGGSGLTRLSTLEIVRREVARTPFGELRAH